MISFGTTLSDATIKGTFRAGLVQLVTSAHWKSSSVNFFLKSGYILGAENPDVGCEEYAGYAGVTIHARVWMVIVLTGWLSKQSI